MIEELTSETSLEIGDHWNAKERARDLADHDPFMEMGMDDIWAKAPSDRQHLEEEEKVDVQLVHRGAGRELLIPGRVRSVGIPGMSRPSG